MNQNHYLALKFGLSLGLLGGLYGCLGDDTGKCCEVLPGRDQSQIPTPTTLPDGTTRNDIRINSAFNCDELACVSYQGTSAYCTKRCKGTDDCPDGFSCASVLQAESCDSTQQTETTADDCTGQEVKPGDTYCVQANYDCSNR